MDEQSDYSRGLRDGELRALEGSVGQLQLQVERHDTRITAQERITYALLGIIAFIEFLPALREISGS